MDYEKKYNEALAWMRELYPGLHGATKEDAEHYFPELRESEDERMVREFNDWLCEEIECRTNDLRDEKDRRTLNMLCYVLTKVKDWFEKQKESLHISEMCKENADSFTDEDERIRKGLIAMLSQDKELHRKEIAYLEKQKYDKMKPIYDARESFESALEKAWNDYHNGYENVDKLEDDYVECAHAKGFREGYLFGLEKQKEQKPTEDKYQQELEATDRWQEGYEAGYNAALNPAEWSEEDTLMLTTIIKTLELFEGRGTTGMQIDWLKSLRPQPHWKPSKVQKEAVQRAIDCLDGEYNDHPEELDSLLKDLEKLM